MHKAKNIYFLIKKKTRWPKAGVGTRQGIFPYSSKPNFNIPVVFRLLNSSNHQVSNSQFLYCLFLSFSCWNLYRHSFISEFPYRLLSVSTSIILYSSLYYFPTLSIFRLPSFCFLIFCFHAACILFFRCFLVCLRLGTLAPSSRWDSEPVNRSSVSAVLAVSFSSNFLCCKPSLTFHSTL